MRWLNTLSLTPLPFSPSLSPLFFSPFLPWFSCPFPLTPFFSYISPSIHIKNLCFTWKFVFVYMYEVPFCLFHICCNIWCFKQMVKIYKWIFFPLQYCEYYPAYDKCKQWLEKNLPDMFQELMAGGKIWNSLCPWSANNWFVKWMIWRSNLFILLHNLWLFK